VPLIPVDVLSVLAGLSQMSRRRFFTIAFTGYFFYTAIVAFVGSQLAEWIGMTEALSVIGALFVVVVGIWLWDRQRQRGDAA
jgi:uncharacterized membrane protein YdjX (TVP38/TMEM64 family)